MFWGLVLEPSKSYAQVVDTPFHVSMAALDLKNSDNQEEASTLILRQDNTEYVLANLSKKHKIFNMTLGLDFDVGEEIEFFVQGQSQIHLTGFLAGDDNDDDLDDFNEEEDENDIEEKLKDIRKAEAAKRKLKENSSGPNKKQKILDESFNDDTDEDDFRVPIFVQSQECCNYTDNLNREKLFHSNPSHFSQHLNSHKVEKTSSMRQEVKSQNSKELATNHLKATSLSTNDKVECAEKQPDSSVYCEPRDSSANSNDRLDVHEADAHENIVVLDKINSSTPIMASRSEEQRGFRDPRNDSGYQDKSSFRSVQMGNVERVDSVSETSGVDSICRLDITPDDVVEIIGQKRFWKARKAILNQQRVFAVQLFELHRLVKVQRLIAEAPQILADESAYLGKPTMASPRARIPSSYPVKVITNVPKKKGEPDKPKENSADDTSRKPSFSSVQNCAPPPMYRPLSGNSPALSISGNQNARPWCLPQGQHWLIPVMTPSEGLVYKPYPGPGFASPDCTGFGPPVPGPMPSNFLPPVCGIPAQHPQYPLPYYHPPAGPHGYFPTYGLPMMNGTTFSGSSVEQNPPPTIPSQPSASEADHGTEHQNSSLSRRHKKRAPPSDVEVEATATRVQDGRGKDDTEQINVLPLFPTSPASDAQSSRPECPVQVIKVVPHNATSATESAARIFRSIQEERKQFDSM